MHKTFSFPVWWMGNESLYSRHIIVLFPKVLIKFLTYTHIQTSIILSTMLIEKKSYFLFSNKKKKSFEIQTRKKNCVWYLCLTNTAGKVNGGKVSPKNSLSALDTNYVQCSYMDLSTYKKIFINSVVWVRSMFIFYGCVYLSVEALSHNIL